jgi:hypothetical protein
MVFVLYVANALLPVRGKIYAYAPLSVVVEQDFKIIWNNVPCLISVTHEIKRKKILSFN